MTVALRPSPLRTLLLRLISLRVVIVTLLLGAGVLAQIRMPTPSWPVDPFFSLLGFTYAMTVLYIVTLPAAERRRWLVDLQFGMDTCLITALVLMTGGVTSAFSSLYTLPILAASAVQDRQSVILVGLLSSLAYGGLILGQYTGTFGLIDVSWIPVVPLPPLNTALYTMGLGVFGFIAVAGLSGHLAERLRLASVRIADLTALNHHVIESLTSGLATTDREGRILTFNPSAERITGRRASEALGRLITDVLPIHDESDELLALRPPHTIRRELSYVTPTGSEIAIGLNVAPLLTPSGHGGLLFVFADVTDARRAERESQLQQRLAAVGEMAAGIAHEIRNPLASMSGSIQILRQDLPLTDDQRQLMDIVLRESARLNETIGAFLAYARPRRFETKHLDLADVLNDTALLLRHSAEVGEHHSVEVARAPAPVPFDADEGQIRQIVWNLAINALHAMPDGGRLRLTASSAPDGGVTLTVEDEGVGIPADEIEHVFQPFRGTPGRGGAGLGLAIVYRIVHDYGGEVSVRSVEGAGTAVEVRLPRQLRPGVPIVNVPTSSVPC